MSTLDSILGFLNTRTTELGLQESFDEYKAGLARRSTLEGYGEALLEELNMDPRNGDFGVLGAGSIHGMNSKLFPASWKGKDGKAWQMMDEGASPREIWDKSLEETGFGIYPQHLYNTDGTFKRIDLKMNVPDINLKKGRRSSIDNMSEMQDYPLTDFVSNSSLEAGYPGMASRARITKVSDDTLGGASMAVKPGKGAAKGVDQYRVNADFYDIEDDLLPTFAHEMQHPVQDAERFAPGGNPVSDKNYRNLAGEVEARAVASEFDTITDLRAKGMDNRQIIQHLGKNPIFENFDTPNIMQEVKARIRRAPDDWQAANILVPGDKGFNNTLNNKAFKLRDKGATNLDILNETGTLPYQTAAGDPINVQFKSYDDIRTVDNIDDLEGLYTGEYDKLSDLLKSEELYKDAPYLRDIKLKYNQGLQPNSGYAERNVINLGPPESLDDLLFTLGHEGGHITSGYKNLPPGANLNDFNVEVNARTALKNRGWYEADSVTRKRLKEINNNKRYTQDEKEFLIYKSQMGEATSNILGEMTREPKLSPLDAFLKDDTRYRPNLDKLLRIDKRWWE